MEHHTGAGCRLADVRRAQTVDLHQARLQGFDGDVLPGEQLSQHTRLRRAHAHRCYGHRVDDLLQGTVGDDPAPAANDQVCCITSPIAHLVSGDTTGATLDVALW